MARERGAERGFTLAEIVIAVLVLGTALVTMISLQSASVNRTLRDTYRQRAMLAARAILAALETRPEDLEEQKLSDSLPGLIQQIDPLDKLQEFTTEQWDQFSGELTIENWKIPLPNFDDDSVKKVVLRISWSESPLDTFEVIFFKPKVPS